MNKKKIVASSKVKIVSVDPLSPHNEALYETGKEMLKDSVSTARDFCKFMITVSTGSIPIYLGLLKFVLPENAVLSSNEIILSILPPFFFLISSILFIFGYFPQIDYLSLDIVDEIKQMYEKTLKKRKIFTNWGIAFYLIGCILAILSILIYMQIMTL